MNLRITEFYESNKKFDTIAEYPYSIDGEVILWPFRKYPRVGDTIRYADEFYKVIAREFNLDDNIIEINVECISHLMGK